MYSTNARRVLFAMLASLSTALLVAPPAEGAIQRTAVIATPRQVVDLPGVGTARFAAAGEGRFKGQGGPFQGEAALTTETASYVLTFRNAEIIERDGGAVGLLLSGRGRATQDGTQEEFDFTASVGVGCDNPDCLIYDFVGPLLHAHFEAEGMLRIAR
jgi:hypothetical protein